jgi:hypothetical protein
MSEPAEQDKSTAPKKNRQKRVGAKQLAVARNVAKGMTLQEAGETVGYPPESARQSAWKAMETIKRKAPEVFDKAGLTLDSLAEDVHRLRRAKEKKFVSFMGSFSDEREVDALDIQIKAVDMGLRVHGAYKEGQNAGTSIRSETNTVCLVVTDERRAAELARLLAPHGSPGVVIDVAPQVHQDVG